VISMSTLSEDLKNMFLPGGALQRALPGFEAREPQVQMVEMIGNCLEYEKHGIIQAPVGTGKSLGYALPAAAYAVQNNKRVIISTNTKDLQRQLIDHDLPLVQKILAEDGHDLIFCGAKGQANYLCKRKLYELMENEPDTEFLQQMVNEVESNKFMTGDRNSFTFDIPADLWKRLEADSLECSSKENPYESSCFALRSRQNFYDSHVIVANHAMFFSDLSARVEGFGVFPNYDVVIFDEGHRIDDVYSNFFRKELSLEKIEKTFKPLQARSSIWMRDIIQGNTLNQLLEFRHQILNKADSLLKAIQRHLTSSELNAVILDEPIVSGENPFIEPFSMLIHYLKKLQFKTDDEDEKRGINSLRMRYERQFDMIYNMLNLEEKNEWAYWIELQEANNPSRQVKMVSVPYEPKTALQHLYEFATVVFASGTIAPGGDFEYPAKRYGLTDYYKLEVSSPFNYYNDNLLIIPKKDPAQIYDPLGQPNEYYDELSKDIKEILEISRGSTFVLFTSMEAIRQSEERLKEWVQENKLELFAQAPGSNRDKMLEDFIQSDHGVLFGAESFWEGINVPGDDLRVVVIPRVPFPNPNDTITKARMIRLEQNGENSFFSYSLPKAIMKMNQGAGRLKRKASDRGAVIILDSRMYTKKYGDQILRSLPNFRRSRNIQDLKRFF
jgi:ATP-dependent DNA helicase DinG